MNLFDTLKQFKNIEPDGKFTAHSKAEILMSPRQERKTIRGIFAFLHIIETSAAVVLAGFFILVLTGNFSGAHSIAPIQYAVIDPAGLHAEAQAVDMQIQLANIDYPQAAQTQIPTTTAQSTVSTGTITKFAAITVSTTTILTTVTSSAIQEVSASSTPSSSISVNEALKQLSQ